MSPLAAGLFKQGIIESHARYAHDTELRYLATSYRTLPDAERAAQPLLRRVARTRPRTCGRCRGATRRTALSRPAATPSRLCFVQSWTAMCCRQITAKPTAGAPRTRSQSWRATTRTKGAVPEWTFAGRRAAGDKPSPGSPHINVTVAEFQAAAHRKFGPLADEYLKLYPATTDDKATIQSAASARDNSRMSTYLWALDWTRQDAEALYTYFWTHRPTGDPLGAHHASEILFVFNNLDLRPQRWTAALRSYVAKQSQSCSYMGVFEAYFLALKHKA